MLGSIEPSARLGHSLTHTSFQVAATAESLRAEALPDLIEGLIQGGRLPVGKFLEEISLPHAGAVVVTDAHAQQADRQA